MPQLVKISPDGAAPVWGFHGPCKTSDIKSAINRIAKGLNGDDHVIDIMSGTHGYCNGRIGAVASRDERFLAADKRLLSPQTAGGKTVKLDVHDFHNANFSGPDPVTAAMAKLNGEIRRIVGSGDGKAHTFLLAYCCSGGTD